MNRVINYLQFISATFLLALLGACAGTTFEDRELSYNETALNRPVAPLKDKELHAVRVKILDPGTLPEDINLAKGLSMEVRKAEALFIPVQLKNTMQRSGHWGPVRVVPKGIREGEIVVSGKIIESDGEILKINISVKDARGVNWFTKEYNSVINEEVYEKANQEKMEPFQYLYNEIANDIAEYKKNIKPKEASKIRNVAELRFGAGFAPKVYSGYLKKESSKEISQKEEDGLQKFFALFKDNEGGIVHETNPNLLYTILRLPSKNDPMVKRVNRIRAREEFLIDTLDQQYDGLARNIGNTYTQWRSARLKEVNAIREVEQKRDEQQGKAIAIGFLAVLAGAAASSNRNCYSCGATGAAIAGAGMAIAVQMATQAAEQAEADTAMRKTALEDLGQSLSTDVKPVIIEVEGKTVELKGTVEEKFKKWREVLSELRENEVGPTREPLIKVKS